uniref:L1 transposable element trimerization domain-containing protein n=1 Tax=Macaca fascicularis TaxID=9541 RepID=A0A7N9CEK2_MACFA
MGKKQGRKAGNSKNKSASPPAKERSSSPATDQSWTENDFDEMREEGFSPSNFSELKEELRTQRKETKNLERKVEELMARVINAEKVINEMKEMKTMTRKYVTNAQASVTDSINWKKEYQRLRIK